MLKTTQNEPTPSDEIADDKKSFSCTKRLQQYRVKVQTLAKHPRKVAHDEILRQNMQKLTPNLQEIQAVRKGHKQIVNMNSHYSIMSHNV